MKAPVRRPDGVDPELLRILLRARVEVDIGQHWRSDERRIVLNPVKPYDFVLVPLRGAMRLRCAGVDGELAPGQCLAIAAGVEHHGELLAGCTALEAATLHCRISAPEAPRLLHAFERPLLPCTASWRRDLTAAVALGDRDRAAGRNWQSLLLRSLLLEAVRGGALFAPEQVNPLLQESARLLEDHPELSIAGVAKRCGCSAARLRQLFTAAFGQSPADYRAARRLREACRRLREDDAAIASIATTCGFGTLRAMQQAFRRHLETTPQAYREAAFG
jgi:AraC-like DNA-binding protein